MRKLAVAFAQLATSSLLGQAIGFAVLAVVARRVGPEGLGSYGFALNLCGLVALPLLGVAMLGTRTVARGPRVAGRTLTDATVVLATSSVALVLGLWFAAPLVSASPRQEEMLRVVLPYLPLTLLTADWALQGFQAFAALGIVRLVGQVVYGVLAFLWLTTGFDEALRYAWLNNLGLAITLAGTFGVLFFSLRARLARVSLRRAWRLLRESLPTAYSLAMIRVYYVADFVLLGILKSTDAVGLYLVAYKVPTVIVSLGSTWVSVLFPHSAKSENERVRQDIALTSSWTLAMTVPVAVGGILVGRPLITILFGPQYSGAAAPFGILLLAAAGSALDGNLGQALIALDAERVFARGVTYGAVINVLLNLALIPLIGVLGAALTTLVAEAVVLGYMWTALQRHVGKLHLHGDILWRCALGAGGMAAVLLLSRHAGFLWVRIAAGGAVYLVTLGSLWWPPLHRPRIH
jgi:O-antigen/teichoic acid export membrane protein